MKLNTDGAAKGNPGIAGVGGLIRGHRGEVHEAFAFNYGKRTCTSAKLMSVLKGLMVAWDCTQRNVEVSLDSKVFVRM